MEHIKLDNVWKEIGKNLKIFFFYLENINNHITKTERLSLEIDYEPLSNANKILYKNFLFSQNKMLFLNKQF